MSNASIVRHHGEHDVRLICDVLDVSRANYYDWDMKGREGEDSRETADQ